MRLKSEDNAAAKKPFTQSTHTGKHANDGFLGQLSKS
jgi:hypothetical protein